MGFNPFGIEENTYQRTPGEKYNYFFIFFDPKDFSTITNCGSTDQTQSDVPCKLALLILWGASTMTAPSRNQQTPRPETIPDVRRNDNQVVKRFKILVVRIRCFPYLKPKSNLNNYYLT